ncbi:hypothetical protein CHS0354_005439 [Potamilus streckersoni]|uniref:Uncharacterized protein n=1 Tax=Potamilus streckersoni TaxID=2493646 RepID=A0AAE0WD81_9BIVA|nr:hypothetical protein CHS0354_005439 [Potamilus streckersoni]
MPFSSGREEDGSEYLNALSSGREDKGRLWSEMPFTSGREDGPEYLNALSTGREDKGRLWAGTGEKIRAGSGQEVPCQPDKTNTNGTFFTANWHNNWEMPFSSGREDGPEYLNALSSGREDKGRLWAGSPLSST